MCWAAAVTYAGASSGRTSAGTSSSSPSTHVLIWFSAHTDENTVTTDTFPCSACVVSRRSDMLSVRPIRLGKNSDFEALNSSGGANHDLPLNVFDRREKSRK